MYGLGRRWMEVIFNKKKAKSIIIGLISRRVELRWHSCFGNRRGDNSSRTFFSVISNRILIAEVVHETWMTSFHPQDGIIVLILWTRVIRFGLQSQSLIMQVILNDMRGSEIEKKWQRRKKTMAAVFYENVSRWLGTGVVLDFLDEVSSISSMIERGMSAF